MAGAAKRRGVGSSFFSLACRLLRDLDQPQLVQQKAQHILGIPGAPHNLCR